MPARPEVIPFSQAVRFWLKLGFISFGGPTGQIAIMHHELVERRRWISEGRFLHALNYCMLLPGPEATQLATYIGWMMHRTWGGIVAGGLFVLPSVFILIALSWIYLAYGDVPLLAGLFYGIKPAVVAIVLAAAHRIGSRALKNAWLWTIAAAAFIAIFAFDAPFPAIVIAAGIAGYFTPGKFSSGGGHAGAHASFGPALIDDHTPTPEHARFSWKKFSAFGFAGLALWALVLGALAAAHGWDGTLTQMGWFFTKAALVTFGGAYAVLPYVVQAAVEQYHWLTALQMIDGLALGETTPGPLIMVVAFVGFIGAGVAGALVATFFTFLPSFIFIFMGAPFIETTHGDLRFTAPLTGITAAVVGVILNLALFFAYHVLWPEGRSGPFDLPSAVIGVAAFVALFRFKAGIIPVIAVCAALGLAARLLL
ncbi:MAG: chromate efflux transporter [Betaproteobacteria bacterium]|nr:MAG: chromate efflux transporter [Betaproteobacteria bacterium]